MSNLRLRLPLRRSLLSLMTATSCAVACADDAPVAARVDASALADQTTDLTTPFAPILPYRPSMSSPAQLPAPGQLEFELGGLQSRAGGARRSSLPYQFKLAFSPQWGLLIGGEAQVWQRDADAGAPSVRGVGDTTLVLKRAWEVNVETGLGVEFGVKLATANELLGSGKTDYSVNTIYSRDLGGVQMDANLNATRLGSVDANSARTQFGASVAFSLALTPRWGLATELVGTRRSGADSTQQVLGALTFSPNPRLTYDFGVARARWPAPASTSVFAGVVFPIARLW